MLKWKKPQTSFPKIIKTIVIPYSSGFNSLVYIGRQIIIIPKEIIDEITYKLAPVI